MLTLIIGYKTPSLYSDAEVVYCGQDGDAAARAVAGLKEGDFARVHKLVNPTGIPVRIPTEAERASDASRLSKAPVAAQPKAVKAEPKPKSNLVKP